MHKLKIILGSTRESRQGEKVGKLILELFSNPADFEPELLDLRDWQLPFFNEPMSPQYSGGKYSSEQVSNWAAKVAEAEAYVIITPEYNHGYPAVLKNALDHAYHEWKRKPVLFVSYSMSPFAGVRAVEQLRQVVVELHMVSLRDAIHIPSVHEMFDDQGEYTQKDLLNSAFAKASEELVWWTDALATARSSKTV